MSKKITVEARTYTEFGGGVVIDWSQLGIGFGQIYIEQVDGVVRFSSEMMSKEFVKEALCALVDRYQIR